MAEEFKFWTDYFELKNGRIRIFKRKGYSNQFYARFTFRGHKGYVQQSLRTANKEEATEAALEQYLQCEFKLKQGLSLARKKFKELTVEYLEHLKSKVDRGEIKFVKYHGERLKIERYFDDFFGEMVIGEIQKKELDQYREWRKNYWISGKGSKEKHITYFRGGKTIKRNIHKSQKSKVAAGATINSEETALRQIFKFAVMKGYIAANEVVQIKTERVKWEGRSTFSEKEYGKLWRTAAKRCYEIAKTNRDREYCYRHLLHNYILIAANCGCRTTELMNLRWRDIEWSARDAAGDGNSIIFSVSGKAKSRDLVANDVCREYLNRLLEKQKYYAKKYNWEFTATDEYVFSDYRGRKIKSLKSNFEALMREAGLTRDKNGKKRSLSSLRIFYCTMRLMRGENIDLYDLALQMGTSVELLQKTYSRLTARLKAHRIKAKDQLVRRNKTSAIASDLNAGTEKSLDEKL